MKIEDVKFEKLVKLIYVSIRGDIECLKNNLSAETPEAASKTWHNTVWDADEYANFACSCASIATLLRLLTELKIPKAFRDAAFEKVAGEWVDIQ